ncbi:MAG: HipA domain-containing protein [Balneolaceae bacterium]
MNILEITNCPSTLAEGFNSYSPTALKRVFYGRKVNHVLPYNAPEVSEDDAELFMENRKRLSISGVQEKVSLVLDKNKLRLARQEEQGLYILKPIPKDVMKVNQVPANEHLTMQIARQVYNIDTAENALIFFQNGDPAYITKRFDVKEDGSKLGKEDFASLAGQTTETNGRDFKYDYSYEQIADLIKEFVPAFRVEMEKFYALVLFNYVFGNGDAHLKNFSLLETLQGDYKLSPAYDLINTRIHVNDVAMALKDGLFKNSEYTESFNANGFYAYDDFYDFGRRIGLLEARMKKILQSFMTEKKEVHGLISRSYLNDEMKKDYTAVYLDKLKAINYSYTGMV